MNPEIYCLIILALLSFVFPFVYNYAYSKQVGGHKLIGNRDHLPARQGLSARGYRAHQNHLENLLPFGVIVLAAQTIGISSPLTISCAVIFTLARFGHSFLYIAGIYQYGVRSWMYMIGLAATLAYGLSLLV